MNRKCRFEELASVIKETLDGNGEVSFVLNGTSMLPTIRDGVDTVTLVKPLRKLKKGDIIFYRRDNGQYILHRIVKTDGDTYTTLGDNQWICDYNIRFNQIIGVVKCIEKNGRHHDSEELQCRIYLLFLPIIRWIYRIYNAIKRRIKT